MEFRRIANTDVSYPIAVSMKYCKPRLTAMADTILTFRDPNKETVMLGTGISGAVVGAYLSVLYTPLKYFHISKENEVGNHRSDIDRGYGGDDQADDDKLWELWIVDDFVSSGQTISNILKRLNDVAFSTLKKTLEKDGIRAILAGVSNHKAIDMKERIERYQINSNINIQTWYAV